MSTTVIPGGSPAPLTVRELIDPRIDVHAQRALHRMAQADPASRRDATGMFAAIKAGLLGGIYIENQLVPAKLAQRMGRGWWQLLPKGEDAALVLDPSGPVTPPIIIFRDSIRTVPTRLDPALRKAWSSFVLLRAGELVRCDTGPVHSELARGAELGALIANLVPNVFCQLRRPRRRRPPPRPGPRPPPPPPASALTLVVASPADRVDFFVEPGLVGVTGPSMPTVRVLGTVQRNGQPAADVSISWKFEVAGNYRVRAGKGFRLQKYALDFGIAVTRSGQQDFVGLEHLRPALIVGGDLKIIATARDSEGRTVRVTRSCRILGKNPVRAQVEAFIRSLGAGGPCGDDGWALLRIFCVESNHRLIQFDKGGVLFGPPAGVGITQRDPEAREWRFPADPVKQTNNFFPRIFWDWQENVREGVRFFRGVKMRAAAADLARLMGGAQRAGRPLPPFCPGVLLRASIRRYNGGREYVAEARGRASAYRVQPRDTTNPTYVDRVLGDPYIQDPIPDPFRHVTAQNFAQPGDGPCPLCTP